MRDLEQQPLRDDAAATQAREEQSAVAPLEKQTTGPISKRTKQARIWRYLLPVGIALLVLAVIVAGVLSSSRPNSTPKVSNQHSHTNVQPVSPPFSIPVPSATPLQASGALSHGLSTSLVDGVAYVGTTNNAVYALRTSDGRVLWHQQIDGAVSQQPLVRNGVVYVNAFIGQYGPDFIYALQASNGAILWRLASNANSSTSNSYAYLSLAPGDSSALYMVSQAGVAALQASSGKVLWHVATQGVGYDAPIVSNGVVYATSSASGGTAMLDALRASDGKLLWHYAKGNYISVSVIANNVVYLASNGDVSALRANDGHPLWHRAIDANTIQQLQLVDDVLYTSATKITEPPAALRIPSSPRVAALSELLYTNPARPAQPFKEGVSSVYAIQASNGSILWRYPLLNGKNSWANWLSAQNGVVYVDAFAATNGSTTTGEIYALQSQNGAVIWSEKLQESPNDALLANGVIYLTAYSDSQVSALYALRADTGALLWSYPISGSIYNAPILAGTTLYVAADTGMFYALRAANGVVLWHYQTNVGA